jgi:hypothetical protein
LHFSCFQLTGTKIIELQVVCIFNYFAGFVFRVASFWLCVAGGWHFASHFARMVHVVKSEETGENLEKSDNLSRRLFFMIFFTSSVVGAQLFDHTAPSGLDVTVCDVMVFFFTSPHWPLAQIKADFHPRCRFPGDQIIH